MSRKKKELEPEDAEPNSPPGESLPAMEDTVRKLSGIFSENMQAPDAVVEVDDEAEDDEDE